MDKNTYWFTHDYNSRADGKVVSLRMKLGMEGVGIYWCLVEMLHEGNGFISINDFDRIAFELGTHCERIANVVRSHGLFEFDNDRFWSKSALKRIEKRIMKSNATKASADKRWQKERGKNMDVNVMRSQSESNAPILSYVYNMNKAVKEEKEDYVEDKAREENFKNSKKEEMIVLEMMKVWKKHNKHYPEEPENDYAACLQFAYKIAKVKGWKEASVVDLHEKDVLASWERIVQFIVSDGFLKTHSLKSLIGQYQSIYMKMLSVFSENKPSKPTTAKKTRAQIEREMEEWANSEKGL